jgi:5-methylcytosine-specific restriction endonuclease McrA
MTPVLVLNQDFRPICLCSVERAFLLIFLSKAEMMSAYQNQYLRTVSQSFPCPSVIKIRNYVNLPYKGVVLSRNNILKRDNHTCQYCGIKENLTLDHLIPKSKGGKTTWTNLVTACKSCNSRKGDRSPEDAGFILAQKPIKPSYMSFIKATTKHLREDWKPFFQIRASA